VNFADRVVARYGDRPLHLFGTVGLVMSVVGALVLVYLLGVKVLGGAIGHRPLLVLGVLLVVAGIQVFSIGLLGELALRIHEEDRLEERESSDADQASDQR
jgi:hypothetical protein